MTITNEILSISYKRIKEFNDVAGSLQGTKEELVKKLDNQLTYVWEEMLEAIEAFEQGDAGNFLKEICDVHVTVQGLLQIAEAAGFNVAEAIERVDINNLSKFPSSNVAIKYPAEFIATMNEKYKRWVIKDSVGKVRKADGYQKVDVSDLAPEDIFKVKA